MKEHISSFLQRFKQVAYKKVKEPEFTFAIFFPLHHYRDRGSKSLVFMTNKHTKRTINSHGYGEKALMFLPSVPFIHDANYLQQFPHLDSLDLILNF